MAKTKTKIITKKPASQKQVTLQAITDLLGGDHELAQFFLEWLENGHNATRAYLKFHPNVTEHSARVLGATVLAKISIPQVLEGMGLGRSKYLEQLEAGLNAGRVFIIEKFDKKTGKKVAKLDLSQPDHKTRRLYHEPLGQMLGLESKSGIVFNQQFNFADLGKAIQRDERARGLSGA